MKKRLLAVVAVAVFGIGLFSCEENKVVPTPESEAKIAELSALISENLNSVADELRKNNQTFTNAELVAEIGKQRLASDYGIDSDAVNAYSEAFESTGFKNTRSDKDVNLSHEADQFLGLIEESLNSAKHLKAFKEKLEVIYQSVIDSELPDNEKAIIQIQIIKLKTSLSFIAANFDLFHPKEVSNGRTSDGDESDSEEDESWWDSWGKCAAGVVGGAGATALSGCGVGAAAGLGVGSVPGCGVGAIVGGISGALIGAASAC